ncbi:hypothetical protein [Dokdonella sp.]|uniref:hypothetical protein n=1 Tax=Dokdonella sp. TaxID=2291710 RepID=UPI001B2B3C1B|nr:hypothetical protein [Dokdonella sp.]MBO9664049.1 hypothetical protein [Dokdonella sp.]
MSYVVISSFENLSTGDLQSQGEAITVFPSEAPARSHFADRASALATAVRKAREDDVDATFVTWLLILRMPLEVAGVEEALEDLELVVEETDTVDDPFGELVVDYQGRRYEPSAEAEHPRKDALQTLEAWLT